MVGKSYLVAIFLLSFATLAVGQVLKRDVLVVSVNGENQAALNTEWRELSIIDVATDKVVATLPSGGQGGGRVKFTPTRAIERAPVWSPDGKRIAFSSDGDGPSEVYVINAGGSNLISLTRASK